MISRSQAVEAGLSANQIQHGIQSGSWLQLTSGVYAPAASTPSWEPPYTRQLPIRYESLAAVDAYVEDWAMIVEGDGRRWHTRKADFELDRQRDNAAVAAGLVVVRFTWKNLRYDPAGCLKTLVEAGKRRSKS